MTEGKLGTESMLSALRASELLLDCLGVWMGVLWSEDTGCFPPPKYSSYWKKCCMLG